MAVELSKREALRERLGDGPDLLPLGSPLVRFPLLPKINRRSNAYFRALDVVAAVEPVERTWWVAGLRGRQSDLCRGRQRFVPFSRCCSEVRGPSVRWSAGHSSCSVRAWLASTGFLRGRRLMWLRGFVLRHRLLDHPGPAHSIRSSRGPPRHREGAFRAGRWGGGGGEVPEPSTRRLRGSASAIIRRASAGVAPRWTA